MKESIVDIGGHQYRYGYDPDTKTTKYLGPVGEAPVLSEEEFFSISQVQPMWQEAWIETSVFEQHGTMNDNTRAALREIVNALEDDNIELAMELSATKSLIVDVSSFPGEHTFEENASDNKELMGKTLYFFLDDLHHNLAMEAGRRPSGLTVITSRGVEPGFEARMESPTLDLIREERARIKRGPVK